MGTVTYLTDSKTQKQWQILIEELAKVFAFYVGKNNGGNNESLILFPETKPYFSENIRASAKYNPVGLAEIIVAKFNANGKMIAAGILRASGEIDDKRKFHIKILPSKEQSFSDCALTLCVPYGAIAERHNEWSARISGVKQNMEKFFLRDSKKYVQAHSRRKSVWFAIYYVPVVESKSFRACSTA